MPAIADNQSPFVDDGRISHAETSPAHIHLGVRVRRVGAQLEVSADQFQVGSARDGHVSLGMGLRGHAHAAPDIHDAAGEIRGGDIFAAERARRAGNRHGALADGRVIGDDAAHPSC